MNDELREFLELGVNTYPPALRAMARFRQEIFLAGSRSMARNLDGLSRATGVAFNKDDIRPYAHPNGLAEEQDWDHTLTFIGVEIIVPNRTHVYAAMYWELDESNDEGTTAAFVSFEPWYVTWQREILTVARGLEGDAVFEYDREVWLQEDVSSANVSNLEALFDKLFARWQAIFENRGGFPTQR